MCGLWTNPKDRMLVAFASVALAVWLGWYGFALIVVLMRLVIPGDSAVYFIGSTAIPSSCGAALVLLLGWGIRMRRPGPPIVFWGFVMAELVAWTVGLGTATWLYISFQSRIGFDVETLSELYTIAAIADAIALFLLLLVLVTGRTPTATPPLSIAPPPTPVR